MTNTVTLAVWGDFESARGWGEWFRFMEESARLFGSPLTHFAIQGEGLGKGTIRSIKSYQKIESSIDSSSVEWLAGYSLPNDFETAVFDFHIHMNRSLDYVLMTVKEDFASAMQSDNDVWYKIAKKFCKCRRGMLFQMDEDETPLFFVKGSSPMDSFDSLKILNEFR